MCWSCRELTHAQFGIIPKNCAPYHLSNLDPTIITSTWIPPLDYHVKYVSGQMMLIKCYFAIIIMVDTIYFASSQSSLKFPSTIGIVHHVLM